MKMHLYRQILFRFVLFSSIVSIFLLCFIIWEILKEKKEESFKVSIDLYESLPFEGFWPGLILRTLGSQFYVLKLFDLMFC